MPTENGFSNQKKLGQAQYKTIHNVGSDKFATNAITKGLIERQLVSIAITGVELSEDTKSIYIEVVGHGVKRAGDVIRFYTGDLQDVELDILSVLSPDIIEVLNVMETLPNVGDEVRTAYFRTPQFDISGNIITSSGPAIYNLDEVPTEVSEDTAFPINNKAFPSALFIKKEGVSYPVNDSVTPAEVVAVPVKIMSAGGTNINITAGDIDVQLTDMGASFDAVRVGDGSGNRMGVTADQEAKVTDAKALAELQEANTTLAQMMTDLSEAAQDLMLMQPDIADIKDGQTALLTELEKKADLTETQPVSVAALPLPTGAATEAKQDTQITALNAINARFNTLGQKASALSMPVALSTEQEAKLDTILLGLAAIDSGTKQRTFFSQSRLTTTGTVNRPSATARGFMVQNSTRANGAARFGATSAGATDGWLLEPGQSTSYIDGMPSVLAVHDVDGQGIDVTILWFV